MAEAPETFNHIMVNQLSTDFKAACAIESVKTPELGESEVLVKNRYVGINASDVNFSSGRYDPSKQPPFACGFEAVGEIVKRGSKVTLPVGQAVAYISVGAFAEYHVISETAAIAVPGVEKEFVTLLVSGATAGLALEKSAQIKTGETVLVTAAAGGTGQFAVQIAKIGECHVIGTCSSASKAAQLKEIGCDRVVNYNEENLGDVLSKEYPKGVDVVYESVGGEMFDTCVNNLAPHGRVIIIGFISGYKAEKKAEASESMMALPGKLLTKNASVHGFFLPGYAAEIKDTVMNLVSLYTCDQLKCLVDNGINSEKGPFKGLESVSDAVEYLYSKKSVGKIVVEL